jgi:hypothetical protein
MKSITVDQMIAEFLKAELHSSRFRRGSLKALEMCGYKEDLLEHPDCNDSQQNDKRAKVLGLCRGWPDKGLFTNFPTNTQWFSCTVTLDQLKKSYRLKSNSSMADSERLLQSTAARVIANESIKNIDNSLVLQIREKIKQANKLPPVILVGASLEGKKVLIEGHSRSVAYSSFEFLNHDIPAIVGISENMSDWAYF